MYILDLTLPTPEENLALDEVLLESCGQGRTDNTLRFWEPKSHFVVPGYSNRIAEEVKLDSTRYDQIPIRRRISGGGTVLQGPGCLNYSLILKIKPGPLASLKETNTHIMESMRQALEKLLPDSRVEGHTDLALGGLKYSGNAQKRIAHAVLFHGSFLLSMDLGLIEKYLAHPTREPSYRKGRTHTDFIRNLNVGADSIKKALSHYWQAHTIPPSPPLDEVRDLAAQKYASDGWNFKF